MHATQCCAGGGATHTAASENQKPMHLGHRKGRIRATGSVFLNAAIRGSTTHIHAAVASNASTCAITKSTMPQTYAGKNEKARKKRKSREKTFFFATFCFLL